MPNFVFISHASEDKAAALSVCAALESNGIDCWIAPRNIVAGVKWAAAIAEAIEESSAIALVLTASSNDSQNVADEINLAKKFDVPIVSIRAEEVVPAKHLELFLTSSHWFDAHPPPLDSHLGGLAQDVHSLIQAGDDEKAERLERRKEPAGVPSTPRDLPSADSSLHRELLFGVVAAQFDFITQEQFLAVCAEWCATKRDSIGRMLVARNWIVEADRVAIEALHQRKLAKHQDNAPVALWASSDGVIRDIIRQSESPEVSRSLDGLDDGSNGKGVSDRTEGGDAFDAISRQSRFEWLRLHRAGGLGHIWMAEDSELGRSVAIKTLAPGKQGPAARQMLLNEARIAGQLEHPNIVPVYEVGRREKDDQPFYAMRLLHGETLTDAIEKLHTTGVERRLVSVERRRLLNVLFDVCNAVAYAHSQGVWHLDLKPDNVVVGMFNEVNLLDWGLARQAGHDQDGPQRPRGTPAYMAPEQVAGNLATFGPRTDIYGLGAILFEILTGRPPHTGDDRDVLLKRIATEPSPSPAGEGKVQNSPQALINICEKAMAFESANRYDSAIVLAEEIQSYLRDEPLEAYRAAVQRARELGERNRDSEAYRDNLARALMNLGVVLHGMERFEDAEGGLAEAIGEYRWLKEHFADNLQYRVNFAAACLQRRTALEALGRKGDAEQMSRDAIWEYEDIIRKSPKRKDLVSIYETMMVEKGASKEEVDEKVNEIAADAGSDSSSVLEKPAQANDGPGKTFDHWVLPSALHAVLFATAALRRGAINIDQLQEAVRAMLGNQSQTVDRQLIDSEVLSERDCEQINASMREIIRASNIAPRAGRMTGGTSELQDGGSVLTTDPEAEQAESITEWQSEVDQGSGKLTSGTVWREETTGDSWHYTDIERFEFIRTIGSGGWGNVLLARDREALRYSAVKEVSERMLHSPELIERFFYEARFAASMHLPGSPQVYAIGQYPDGRPYYAMQYIDGEPIDTLLARNADFSLGDAIRALIRVTDCLHVAHSHGFVHRDVKPKHILVASSGETYFTDWGLVMCLKQAKQHADPFISELAANAPREREGSLIGTPVFMSPEQARGDSAEIGPATDIYSVGATLYKLLTGRVPYDYDRESRRNTIEQIRAGVVVPPSQVAEGKRVPNQLEGICMKALARDPEDRYSSAQELGTALCEWLSNESDSPWFQRAAKWLRNRPTDHGDEAGN